MSSIKRVEEETIIKQGKIIGINYRVWYKEGTKRIYQKGHYKEIPMTILNYILDETNEAITKYQEFEGYIYKRTTYQQPAPVQEPAQQPQEATQEAPAAEAEQQPTETAEAAQAAPAARQTDDITAAMVDAIGADAPAHSVTVTWANGSRATYSAGMLDMLRTDPAALDIQDDTTGELVYIRPDDAPTAQAEADPTETAEQTTTNEQKEEDKPMSTTANELQKYVDGIAADLRKLYEADPTDEEREAAEENGDACDLYSYFEDVLDIEYTISSRGDYLGARIAVALGGPNIYIDTREGYVKGYWGTDREEAWIPSEICEEIDSIMEEYYDMVRGA